jgi:hypothetical protein
VTGAARIGVMAARLAVAPETTGHRIRRYDPRTGTISRVAGTGTPGASGVGGRATSCELDRPHGVQPHPATGDIHVADTGNHRVLRLEPAR